MRIAFKGLTVIIHGIEGRIVELLYPASRKEKLLNGRNVRWQMEAVSPPPADCRV